MSELGFQESEQELIASRWRIDAINHWRIQSRAPANHQTCTEQGCKLQESPTSCRGLGGDRLKTEAIAGHVEGAASLSNLDLITPPGIAIL